MFQQVKVIVTKPDDLNLISETHRIEGENQFPQVFPHHILIPLSPLPLSFSISHTHIK